MIRQIGIIALINLFGNIISKSFNLPLPGSIVGLILLFLLLYVKVIEVKKIQEGANLLLINMAIFFVPPGVQLIKSLDFLKDYGIKIGIIAILTTIITMATTGLTVQFFIRRK